MHYANEIIKELVGAMPAIKELCFIKFPSSVLLQDRIDEDEHQAAINEALENREKYGLPFWDSLLLTQFKPEYFSPVIIKEASFHNPITDKTFVGARDLHAIETMIAGGGNIGLNSLVKTADGVRHLPLLDFHIPAKEKNMTCVQEVLALLGYDGYLLQTNRSYHFYGKALLTEQELISFLSKALLFSPVIDKNWIAHQLIERSATLRISAKDGGTPFLLSEIKK